MSVGELVGGLADHGQVPDDVTGASAQDDEDESVAAGRRPFGSGVRVSGVDLDAEGQRSGGLRYTAPGEDGRAVETGGQQSVERKADRRGKKVKRKRR